MKKWTILLWVICTCTDVSAQFFEVDSLPPSGILLNQHWKWRVGDAPRYAESNLDDSAWENIDPGLDVMQLAPVREAPVVWFRLRFILKDTAAARRASLVMRQTGASEIYLNGRLLVTHGHIGTEPVLTRGYDPWGAHISLPLADSINTLAIRFSLPELFLVKTFYKPNPCLKLVLTKDIHTETAAAYVTDRLPRSYFSGYFKAGIFFILSILHLLFFFTWPYQKANIYFALYTFLMFFLIFTEGYTLYYIHELALRNTLSLLCLSLHSLVLLLAFTAIYHLLGLRRRLLHRLTTGLCLVCIPVMIRPYGSGTFYGLLIPSVWVGVAVILVSYKAYKEGRRGAFGIFMAGITFLFFYTLYILTVTFFPTRPYYGYITEFTFTTSILALPVALSYYLALEFAGEKKKIEQNLIDFRKLAGEKEAILLRQNAELQAALLEGQTTERKRVASDLHDSLGSTLSSLRWSFEAIDKTKLDPKEQEIYRHLQTTLDTAYDQVRLLSHNLLPQELEKQGLWKALEHLINKLNKVTGIRFSLRFPDDPPHLSSKTAFEIYSICLELVNNILKHARAQNVNVSFEKNGRSLHLSITDDGTGMPENIPEGRGLHNIADRISELSGTWETLENRPSGTVHRFSFPW